MVSGGDSDGEAGERAPWRAQATTEAAERVARSMERILNDGNVDTVDEYHSPDLDYYRSSDEHEGREALKDDVRMFLSAFPDLEATVEEVISDQPAGDAVAFRYRMEGTHAGTFENIPPTDVHVDAQGIGMARLDDDEIVEFSLVFDNLGMLQDLGLVR
ncbi:ester cyclase [Halobacteriales archaeon Cl-PHB]